MLAGRHLDKPPRRRAGHPGDHRRRADRAPGGRRVADFAWPPTRETIAATLAEVERCTRRGATINVFMLDDEPRLVSFMHEMGRRNGGRVFLPNRGSLGEYVVSDYLRTRRAAAVSPGQLTEPTGNP